MNKKNRPLMLALVVVLSFATVLAGATFAWFTATDDVVNHLETNHLTDGDVVIQEVWDPEDGKDFEPGTEVNKDVGAVNTGDTDAFVRISFEEVLQKLTTGTPTELAAAYVDATDYASYVPVQVNADAYSDWVTLTSGDFTGAAAVLGINTNVVIKVKATTTNVPGSTSDPVATKTTYNFAAYIPVTLSDSLGNETIVNQKVELKDLSVVNGTLSVSGLKYLALAKAAEAKKDWVADLAATIVASIATGGIEDHGNVYSSAKTSAVIDLLFTDAVITSSSVANKAALESAVSSGARWLYNEADGWFYYLDILGSGETTSANVLDALYMETTAGNDYSYTNFDVTAKMEAVQAIDEALGTGGFDLTAGTAIYDYLASLNA
jgi:hypothetical protein